MGIAQEIADMGPVIFAAGVQRDHLHSSDRIFARDKKVNFTPIKDEDVRFFTFEDSRALLQEMGIAGTIIHTPGHSDDSISLMLDSGELFVGDLNPLYELELHKGTQIGETWNALLAMHPPMTVFAGEVDGFYYVDDGDAGISHSPKLLLLS